MRNNSGIIGSRQTPSTSAASGLFSLIDQQIIRGAGLWPVFNPASIYSISFDGIAPSDYITFPATGDFGVNAFFGSGKTFTVEAWIYPTSLVTEAGYVSMILGDGNPTGTETFWTVSLSHDKKPHFFWYDGNVNSRYVNTALTLNVWTHLAWVASAGSMSIYVNGVSQTLLGSPTTLTNPGGSGSFGTMEIGVDRGRIWAGYLSNLRAVRGTALYTSNFTPPTTNFDAGGTSLLLGTSNSLTDASSPPKTLTIQGQVAISTTFGPNIPASIYLDGTGDYMTFPATGDFAKDAFFGSGKTFTVEAWIRPTSLNADTNYFSFVLGDGNPTGPEMCWNVGMSHDGKPAISWYDGSSKSAYVSTALTLNVWTHVAWVASAGSVSIYVNGVSQALSGTTTLTNCSQTVLMAIAVDRGRNWGGYLSNLRAVKGTALYTSNFTPSTTNLTAVTNTSLLLGQYQAFTVDFSGNGLTVTKSGNATYSTSVLPF